MGGSPPLMNGNTPVGLDPLTGLDSARMPLRSKVFAVPAWKKTYLQHVYTIANEQFDWKNIGPVIAQYRKLIEADVKADTRKLYSFESFITATDDALPTGGGRTREMSLRTFMDQRREYLINHPEVKKAMDNGLATTDALKAMTINIAKIYNVDDRLGSIEKGKLANLVITNGELLQERPPVKMVFIDGVKYEPTAEAPTPGARMGGTN